MLPTRKLECSSRVFDGVWNNLLIVTSPTVKCDVLCRRSPNDVISPPSWISIESKMMLERFVVVLPTGWPDLLSNCVAGAHCLIQKTRQGAFVHKLYGKQNPGTKSGIGVPEKCRGHSALPIWKMIRFVKATVIKMHNLYFVLLKQTASRDSENERFFEPRIRQFVKIQKSTPRIYTRLIFPFLDCKRTEMIRLRANLCPHWGHPRRRPVQRTPVCRRCRTPQSSGPPPRPRDRRGPARFAVSEKTLKKQWTFGGRGVCL